MSDNDYFVNNILPIIIVFIVFMLTAVYCLLKRRYRRDDTPILDGRPIYSSDIYVLT
jgi:heme/copper-type cytochrome/quinol oxidase subunit 2